MDFKIKSENYVVGYSKKDTIKMLEKEPIVDKVENKRWGLIIHTKPIKPKGWLFKHPVGSYIIELKANLISLGLKISRKEGLVYPDWVHNHISTDWSPPICFGNIVRDVEIMKKNKDWYWLSRKLIEFIQDWKYDNDFTHHTWKERMKDFQKNYMENK